MRSLGVYKKFQAYYAGRKDRLEPIIIILENWRALNSEPIYKL